MYNNDLVGKEKPWGPAKDLEPWQKELYETYKAICKGNPDKYESLSAYVEAVKEDNLIAPAVELPEIDEDFPMNPPVLEEDTAEEPIKESYACILDGVRFYDLEGAARSVGCTVEDLENHMYCRVIKVNENGRKLNKALSHEFLDAKGVKHSVFLD